MCGIVGVIDHHKQTSQACLESMRDTLVYRGPDSAGAYRDESAYAQVGLAHRRLSILDLSVLGNQPMHYEDLHIVYNGEVYNFDEIKDELISLGYDFVSHTDTEVILKAFHAWGVECVEKFRGMFAFVIYDKKSQKLFMFRDRAGVKPFYYYAKEGLFLFASELKAFAKHPKFTKRINKEVIPTYMRFGYIPAPHTIFEDTYKMKAGHYIEYDLESENFEIRQYWDINVFYRKEKIESSEDEVLERLEKELKEAFSLRMVADVPVGVFLSGGIDSSLVTAILQKESKEPLKTFTIGFDEPGYNEAEHAKEIATYLRTDHTEYYCSKEDALRVILELPKIYDEPFGDSSAIATVLVSQLAKEKVSVVLSGDGGDEVFCGYSKYFALNKVVRFLEPGLRKTVLKKILNVLDEETVLRMNALLPKSKKQTNIRDKFQKFKRALHAEDLKQMFIEASSYVEGEAIENLLHVSPKVLQESGFESFDALGGVSPVEQMMAVDFQTFMADDVLTKVDRATMSVSIEGREPLLDHKITEYMARIPMDLKYKNSQGKYLLKKILYTYIPKAYYARAKSGFQVPLFEWLKNDLRHLLEKYLSHERLSAGGVFDAGYVQNIVKKYDAGMYVNINEIWFILMFEMWREEWGL